jgi:hypothetical protein
MPWMTGSPILLRDDLITLIQQYHTVRSRLSSLVNGSSRAGLVVNTGIYVINIPGVNVTRITIQDMLCPCTIDNPLLINHIVLDGFDLTLEDITSYANNL